MHLLLHSFLSDWFKVSLYLVSINTFEYQGLVAYHKELPSSSFQISCVGPGKAVIVPTCDIPLAPVPFQINWKHILTCPWLTKGSPWLHLGADVFVDDDRWSSPPESSTALETEFGWALCGNAGATSSLVNACVTTFYSTVMSMVLRD